MTKSKAISLNNKLASRLEVVKDELTGLLNDVEETSNSIEPHTWCSKLNAQQQERKDWFKKEEITIKQTLKSLGETISNLRRLRVDSESVDEELTQLIYEREWQNEK